MIDDKGIKLLVKRLQSDNTKDVLFAINEIRNSGEPKIISNLLDLLITNQQKEINQAIIEVLNELKNQDCAAEIIEALKNDEYHSIQKELLTSCWHSGLDYSDYLDFFVGIVIANDFLISFEAYTIIETFEKDYDILLIDTLSQNLRNNAQDMTEEKRSLVNELIKLLETKKLQGNTLNLHT